MNKNEALTLALVVEEFDNNDESLPLELLKPITATLRALAQPWPDLTEQQRESYQKGHNDGVAHHKQAVKVAQPDYRAVKTYHEGKPMYVSQPEQEPEWYHFIRRGEDCFVPYKGQAPEGATFLYTTPPAQPEQKPYGWIDVYGHFWNHKTSEDDVPLYTTPPRREWVGLTDEQRLEMADNSAAYQVVLATEAKLKEKNT